MRDEQELASELAKKINSKAYDWGYETGKVFIWIPNEHPFEESVSNLQQSIDVIIGISHFKSTFKGIKVIFRNYSESNSAELSMNVSLIM